MDEWACYEVALINPPNPDEEQRDEITLAAWEHGLQVEFCTKGMRTYMEVSGLESRITGWLTRS